MMTKQLSVILVLFMCGLAHAEQVDRTFAINKPYLLWPIQRQPKGGIPDCRFFLYVDDELFTFADIQLPRGKPDFWVFTDLSQYQGKTLRIKSTLHGYEIEAEFDLQTATEFGFILRGQTINYTVATHELHCGDQVLKVAPVNNRVKLHLFLDTTSVEVFINDGYAYVSAFELFDTHNHAISIHVAGGKIVVPLLKVHSIKSIWP